MARRIVRVSREGGGDRGQPVLEYEQMVRVVQLVYELSWDLAEGGPRPAFNGPRQMIPRPRLRLCKPREYTLKWLL